MSEQVAAANSSDKVGTVKDFRDPDGNRYLSIADGSGVECRNWATRRVSWSEFARELGSPERMHVSYADYWSMKAEDRKELKDGRGFVGGGVRGKNKTLSAMEGRDLLTFDFERKDKNESLPINFAEILHAAFPYEHVIYSTVSHRPESPRLRLIMPVSRTLTVDEYEGVMRILAGRVGIGNFDTKSSVASQFMYYPKCPRDADPVYQWNRGPWLDVDAFIAETPDFSDMSTWPGKEGVALREHKKSIPAWEAPDLIGVFNRRFPIDDAISIFLPDIYEPGRNGRYTYTAGSMADGLVVYQDNGKAFSNHHSDPASGEIHGEVGPFDIVRLHLFRDADEGIDLEGKQGLDVPSFCRMYSMIEEKYPEMLDEAAAQRKKEREDAEKEVAKAPEKWRSLLRRTKSGAYDSGPSNVEYILRYDPDFLEKIWYNEMTYTPFFNGKLPWDGEQGPAPFSATDLSALSTHMDRFYGIRNETSLKIGLLSASNTQRKHPLREKIQSVPWDGVARIETCLRDYCGAADTPEHRLISRRWFIGGAARIFNPGCKFDYCLVLAGPQGLGKSQFFKRVAMMDELYLELDQRLDGTKVVPEVVQGRWIVEFGEMTTVNRSYSSQEAVKAFLSKTEDPYRAAYAPAAESHKRQCIFGGTSNKYHFLCDPTGSRRFWPVSVDRAAMGRMWETLTPDVVQQLWAEALYYYQSGERVGLNREEEDLVEKLKGAFTEEDDNEAPLRRFLDMPLPREWGSMSDSERMAAYLSWNDPENPPDYVDATGRWDFVRKDDLLLFYMCNGNESAWKQLAAKGRRETDNIVAAMGNVEGLGREWAYKIHKDRGKTARGWVRINKEGPQ